MELRHIRYFLAVAEQLNFTKAAEQLCIAQPPLSRQIQDLESELGVQLFVRTPHHLQLTEAGRMFKQDAQKILELVNKSTDEIKEATEGIGGTLYLGSVEGHGPHLIAEWIGAFKRQYPHVKYNIWNGNSDDVIDRVMNGLCDLAVIMEPYNAEGLNAISVYKEPWVAIIPADHPLAKEKTKPISLQSLVSEELILPSRKSRISEILNWFDNTESAPVIRCEIAHMMNAYYLTRHKVGIAIFPASALEVPTGGKIVMRTIDDPDVKASYVLVWNKQRSLSQLAERFMDMVKESVLQR